MVMENRSYCGHCVGGWTHVPDLLPHVLYIILFCGTTLEEPTSQVGVTNKSRVKKSAVYQADYGGLWMQTCATHGGSNIHGGSNCPSVFAPKPVKSRGLDSEFETQNKPVSRPLTTIHFHEHLSHTPNPWDSSYHNHQPLNQMLHQHVSWCHQH